jgi:hypothetical protein
VQAPKYREAAGFLHICYAVRAIPKTKVVLRRLTGIDPAKIAVTCRSQYMSSIADADAHSIFVSKGDCIVKKPPAIVKNTPATRRYEIFSARLETAINESDLTHSQLARRLGYKEENVIKSFQTGELRVPLSRIATLARLLDLDPGDFVRDWFLTYDPEALFEIEEVIGLILTGAERSWIRGIRRHLGAAPYFEEAWGDGLVALVDGCQNKDDFA